MTAHVRNITIDCADPEKLGRWWAEVTGYGDHPDNPNNAGDPEWLLYSPEQQVGLLFVAVPEGKTVKNRVHTHLQPQDRDPGRGGRAAARPRRHPGRRPP